MLFGSRLNRLATSIRRGISKYAVGSDNPGLVFDFIDNFYQKEKNQTVNFDGAITHARSSNATMTDGYGPELVVNGGFTSDSDWTKGTGWSIANGYAHHASGANSNITQSIAVEADKAYIIEFNILEGSADFLWFAVAGVFTAVESPQVRGKRSFVFTHDTTESIAVGIRAGSSNVATIDNVSVREMPVIKWAPHNLLTYSEDFSQWTAVNTVVESNISGVLAPDGSVTVDLLRDNTSGTTFRYCYNLSSGTNGTWTGSVFIKLKDANRYLQLRPSGLGTGVAYATFDPSDGSVYQSGGSALVSTSSVSIGDGWYHVSITCSTALASSGDGLNLALTDGTSGELPSYTGDGSSGIYIWGAHLYRSDLGGMVDNPDRGDSYVPTTSSAKQLPRIGHHVYNGSAWVNEGLLAESESRTNLVDYSDFSSGWIDGGAGSLNLTENSAVSPDGTQNALEVESTGSGSSSYIKPSSAVFTNGLSVAVSVYVKAGTHSIVRIANNNSNDNGAWFDLSDGTIGTDNDTGGHGNTASIEEVGNGWYRLSRYFGSVTTGSNDIIIGPSNADGGTGVAPANTTMYFYGVQAEVGATRSSLIPTSGSSVTRAAETFTIPSANLPWSQSYGTEVSASSWTGSAWDTFTSTGDDFSANKSTAGGTAHAYSNTAVTVVSGQSVKIDVDFDTGTNTQARIGLSSITNSRSNLVTVDPSAGGTKSVTVTATTSGTFSISVRTTLTGTINVTGARAAVVTNDPVSIAMDGRITYANTWTSATQQAVKFFSWRIDNDNKLLLKADSTDAAGERLTATHEVNNVIDFATFNDFVYEGVLQSVNVALRVGSTFFQVAANGQTGAENATLTSLVDLSATDLDLVDDDYMGTIGTFRVWDKDLGDDGIVEATNPSLEPSLSLTFEGTGTNSFIVNDWSQ